MGKKREKEYIKAKNMWEKVHKDILEKCTMSVSKRLEKYTKIMLKVTRAYNGLQMFGKFAEEEGIDIKKSSNAYIPENNTEFGNKSMKTTREWQCSTRL